MSGTVIDALLHFARVAPDRVAVDFSGDRVTYAELNSWADGVGTLLAAHGVTPGGPRELPLPAARVRSGTSAASSGRGEGDYVHRPPILFEQIAKAPGFGEADLEHLTTAHVGGARVPPDLFERWRPRGVLLRQLYGQTEIGGSATVTVRAEAEEHPDKCGWGTVFTRIRVVDPDGVDCPAGGLNISPAEIEAVVGSIEGVAEVAVFGVQDAKFGETPAAVVVATRADLTAEEIIARCNSQLADYKVPRYLVLSADPLPRMASGKIDKRTIRSDNDDLVVTHDRVR
ncbi:AMP-binding protein [Gordonia sp. HY285]|uniref:class I adenylate-forming enzyme family protein n=1 Tax=Gordonia liuliyuniae TaxID=2911517 RepID=UPI001F3A634B|nr:AMP-binding protein [Gordonia liuliyuniae]MCF8610153.1 AMP-binding protein [Gordonia liuliyuniae]